MILLLGRHYSGKNTMMDACLQEDVSIQRFRPYTTRIRREQDRDHYILTSEEKFERCVRDGLFLCASYELIGGMMYKYGYMKSELTENSIVIVPPALFRMFSSLKYLCPVSFYIFAGTGIRMSRMMQDGMNSLEAYIMDQKESPYFTTMADDTDGIILNECDADLSAGAEYICHYHRSVSNIKNKR